MLLGSRLMNANYAFIAAGRAYILGAILTTVSLILLGAKESARFGNDELLPPNALGFLYGSSLCFLSVLPLYRYRLVRLVATTAFFILLVLTFSKTSIIAMLSAWGAVVISQRGWSKAKYALGTLAAGSAVFLSLQEYIRQQIEVYTSNPSLVETLTGRTNLWLWTLDMVSESPWVGYGFATFRDIFSHYSMSIGFTVPATQAHNAFLDALFTGGVIGLFLFFINIFATITTMLRTVKRLVGTPQSSFLVMTMTFILVRSLTEGTLNLGRDFVILITAALLAERWSVESGLIRYFGKT